MLSNSTKTPHYSPYSTTRSKTAGFQTEVAVSVKNDFAQLDLICLSHLRWDFIFQRPQHLLTRFARSRRVFFFEEPYFDSAHPRLEIITKDSKVTVATPHLPEQTSQEESIRLQKMLLNQLLKTHQIDSYLAWYYTPMALSFSEHLLPVATVYDCMDELSAFRGANSALPIYEERLMQKADVMFTGGRTLFEAKRHKHPNVHALPSSIDVAHFHSSRLEKNRSQDPQDQASIAHPRIGYFGAVDERLDYALLETVARARPEWQFIIIGPVVKVDSRNLPRMKNIHYLGNKNYQDLPKYLATWDVAMMPFALNESTKFISPTKTPEYLAAGKRVVSTAITDVVTPYGDEGFVEISHSAEEFIQHCEKLMQDKEKKNPEFIKRVDQFLSLNSWDATANLMLEHIKAASRFSHDATDVFELPENRYSDSRAWNSHLTNSQSKSSQEC